MGIVVGSLWKVAKRTKCLVIMYDYSGYGLSCGKPSERNIYADIEGVVNHLITKKGFDPKSIVLYGESIGSVPSIYMASRMSIGGVILQAALASGLKTLLRLKPFKKTWSFDPFPNIERMDKINCPGIL